MAKEIKFNEEARVEGKKLITLDSGTVDTKTIEEKEEEN